MILNWLRNLFRSNPWEKTGEFTHPKYRLRGDSAPAAEPSPCVTAASGRSLVVTGPHFSQLYWRDVWYAEVDDGIERWAFLSEPEARAFVEAHAPHACVTAAQQRQMPARPMALRSRAAWSVQPTKESK